MERPLTVGQLAHATGVPAKTIRYYEQVGVLPVPRRSGAGYRHYSRHDVHRLLFIRRARALGLSLANLKALTAELDSGECLTMRPRLHALVTEQLRTVQQQIAEFQLLERQLAQVLQRLQTTAPASHADGCQCLGSETPEEQEPLQHPLPIPRKGEAMHTSTLEPLTILAPSPLSETTSAGDEQLRVRLWLWRVPHAVSTLSKRLTAHRRPSKRTAHIATPCSRGSREAASWALARRRPSTTWSNGSASDVPTPAVRWASDGGSAPTSRNRLIS